MVIYWRLTTIAISIQTEHRLFQLLFSWFLARSRLIDKVIQFVGWTKIVGDLQPVPLFRGFTLRRKKYFICAHTFSIGFKSGDSGGVGQWLTLLSLNQDLVERLVCFGSLSCMNLCPSGNVSRMKGRRHCSSISWYPSLSSLPVKIQSFVAPFREMPAHTCTLYGCFGFCFSRGLSPFFL